MAREGIEERIEYLKRESLLDGISLIPSSASDLLSFLRENSWIRRPLTSVSDDGCLRATWRGKVGESVIVEFHGNDRAGVYFHTPGITETYCCEVSDIVSLPYPLPYLKKR